MARPNNRRKGGKKNDAPKQFEERLLEVRKVTRVTTGGRQMAFRATMLIGNKKGQVGIGIAKGNDVAIAVQKAVREAYKNIVTVPVATGATVPYVLEYKNKASRVRLIPAAEGTGLKAGSSLRTVLELAGYENVLSKIIGSTNKLNVALTTLEALGSYKHADHFSIHTGAAESTPEEKKESDTQDVPATETKKAPAKKPAAKKTTKADEEKKTVTKKPAAKKAPAKKPAAKKTTKADEEK
ncbi:MAG: 30S ribosomal protein S5 [Candidatus Peribacteria bacterium]|nr:MAG: 30S ribosomal protein S5 [Candidatus Peribacteria bacterium]